MLLKQAEQSVSVSHVPSTDDGARTLAGHMGAREAVCAISERVGCRSYRQKGNPLQAAPLPSREGNPLARRLSLPPRHSTLPGYSRSGQADPACASIKKTLTCFSWGNSYWELNSFHGARHVAILEVEASVRPHHPRD